MFYLCVGEISYAFDTFGAAIYIHFGESILGVLYPTL